VVGQTVSHYRIVERLGGGGMGVVYKALDTHLDRFVALKLLSPELTKDRDANDRFMQEAQAASALDHPNVCTIHEIDETAGHELFLTMAYYEGETLKKGIERGPLPVEDALNFAIQMAGPVASAPGRRRAPRREAGQHDDHQRRSREDRGLRSGKAHRVLGSQTPSTTCRVSPFLS
jgi:serine/threonine-protein kinase